MNQQETVKKSRQELQQECAAISYSEIERFFAKGMLVLVANDANIIDVALQVQADDTKALELLISQKKVIRVHDEHAIKWSQENSQLLAVTAVPWLLVQEIII